MRISDWSSDVCSSDLLGLGIATEVDAVDVGTLARIHGEGDVDGMVFIVWLRHAVDVGEGITFVTQAPGDQFGRGGHQLAREHLALLHQQQRCDLVFREIGRASCRERGCPYVWFSVVAVSLKIKEKINKKK